MAIRLSEFVQLSKRLQCAVLYQAGIPLMPRMRGRQYLMLYSLGNFYVEASWWKEHELKYIYAFDSTSELAPYLDSINWHEFV